MIRTLAACAAAFVLAAPPAVAGDAGMGSSPRATARPCAPPSTTRACRWPATAAEHRDLTAPLRRRDPRARQGPSETTRRAHAPLSPDDRV